MVMQARSLAKKMRAEIARSVRRYGVIDVDELAVVAKEALMKSLRVPTRNVSRIYMRSGNVVRLKKRA